MIANSDAFYNLKAPIKRLAGLDVPIPFCKELEKGVVPTAGIIEQKIREMLMSKTKK